MGAQGQGAQSTASRIPRQRVNAVGHRHSKSTPTSLAKTRQPPQVRYASILNINGGWWSQPSRNQSDSDRTKGLGATDHIQGWAFVKKSLHE